jgi:hypothetical protein
MMPISKMPMKPLHLALACALAAPSAAALARGATGL